MFVIVLSFHIVQIYNLNSIPMLCLPYQFTCNFKQEHLIVLFIICTNTKQKLSILSPPVELHIFLPNRKRLPWVGIA